MGKGSSNTTTTTSKPPQIYLDAYRALMGQAQQVATQPLQQYQGDIVAGFSPAQQSAFNTVNNAQGMGMPYINAAMGYTQQSTNPLNYASLNSGQLGDLSGGSMDYFNQAGQGTNVPGLDIQSYMNPYTQDVINSSLGLMDQENQAQQSQLQGNAISKGAWGGDRAGIAQNDLAQKQQLAKQQMVSQLNNQNYNQALGAAQQQQGVGVQTGLADAQRQAGLAQQGLGAFGQQGQLGLAGGQAQAFLNSNAASQLGQFGQEAFNQALTGAQSQLGIGNLQQQLQQAYMNVPYQMFLQQQAYPFQTTGWLGNLTEGLGSQSGGTSSTTAPGASPISTALGGLGMLGGIAGGSTSGKGSGNAGGASTSASGGGKARGGRIPDGYAPGGAVAGPGGSANGKGSMMSKLPMFANGQMSPTGGGHPGAGGNGFMQGLMQHMQGGQGGAHGKGSLQFDPSQWMQYIQSELQGLPHDPRQWGEYAKTGINNAPALTYGGHSLLPHMSAGGSAPDMILDPRTGGLMGEGAGGLSDALSFLPNPAGKGPPMETSQTSSGGGKGKGSLGDIVKTGAQIGMMFLKDGGRAFNYADGGAVDVRKQLMDTAGDRSAQARIMKEASFGGGGKANGIPGTWDNPWSGWLNTYMQGTPQSVLGGGGGGGTGNMGKGAQIGQDAMNLVGTVFGKGTGGWGHNQGDAGRSTNETPLWLQKLVPESTKNARNSNPANVPNYAGMGVGNAAPPQNAPPSNLTKILQSQGVEGYAGGGGMFDIDPTGEGDFPYMPTPESTQLDPDNLPLPASKLAGLLPPPPDPSGQDVLMQALNNSRGAVGMDPLKPDFSDGSKNSPDFMAFLERMRKGPWGGDSSHASTMHGTPPGIAGTPHGAGPPPPPQASGPPNLMQVAPPNSAAGLAAHHLPHDRTGTGRSNDVLPPMEGESNDWWDKFQKSPWFLLADAGARTLAGGSPNAAENIGAGVSGAMGDYGKQRQSQADGEARRMMEEARNTHADKQLDEDKRYHDILAGDKESIQSKRVQEALASLNKMYNDNLFAKPGDDDKVALGAWTKRQADLAQRMAQLSDQLIGGGGQQQQAPAANAVAALKDGKPHKMPNGKTVQWANGKWIVS